VRCEVLEAQSGALEQASERFIGAQSAGAAWDLRLRTRPET